jgi:Lhr-like helicase
MNAEGEETTDEEENRRKYLKILNEITCEFINARATLDELNVFTFSGRKVNDKLETAIAETFEKYNKIKKNIENQIDLFMNDNVFYAYMDKYHNVIKNIYISFTGDDVDDPNKKKS